LAKSVLFATPDWVTLTHNGEAIAEAWSMPEGGRDTLVFLVPRERLEQVTIETLLIAAQVSKDDVESWRLGEGSDGTHFGLNQPLPLPSSDDTHLTVYVTLKSPVAVGGEEKIVTPEQWQAIEALWKTILGLEAAIDASRLGMDGLRSEMESSLKKQLSVDEKTNALQNDVTQWSKAKTRIQHALPKLREFVHRATFALAAPERKRFDDIVKNHLEPRIPFPEVDRLREQLEHLQKDRQVLLAQGNAVNHECRGIISEVQRALNSLQRNAADRAAKKRSAARGNKGKLM
jgi:uncharacterized protein YoxC